VHIKVTTLFPLLLTTAVRCEILKVDLPLSPSSTAAGGSNNGSLTPCTCRQLYHARPPSESTTNHINHPVKHLYHRVSWMEETTTNLPEITSDEHNGTTVPCQIKRHVISTTVPPEQGVRRGGKREGVRGISSFAYQHKRQLNCEKYLLSVALPACLRFMRNSQWRPTHTQHDLQPVILILLIPVIREQLLWFCGSASSTTHRINAILQQD